MIHKLQLTDAVEQTHEEADVFTYVDATVMALWLFWILMTGVRLMPKKRKRVAQVTHLRRACNLQRSQSVDDTVVC